RPVAHLRLGALGGLHGRARPRAHGRLAAEPFARRAVRRGPRPFPGGARAMRRALVAILLVVALASIALAAWLVVPRSPRFLAWRYRGHEEGLFALRLRDGRFARRAPAVALYLLGLEAARDPDPMRRMQAALDIGNPCVIEY